MGMEGMKTFIVVSSTAFTMAPVYGARKISQCYRSFNLLSIMVPWLQIQSSILSCTDLIPGDFVHVIGDAHVYRTHIRPLQEQLQKLPKPFPVSEIEEIVFVSNYPRVSFCSQCYSITHPVAFMQILKINSEKKDIDAFVAADFKLIGYDPHQKIEMKLAV